MISNPVERLKYECPQLIFLLVLFLFSFRIHAQQEPPDDNTIRVLTFNIKHGETMKGDFDLDLIAGVIRSCDPDIVALQEVDFHTRRVQGIDLVLELACRSGMVPLFGQAMDFDGGGYGEAVLSKRAFLSSKVYPLDASPGNEPRAALMVEIEWTEDRSIFFIATHLDHTHDPADRISQATQINSILEEISQPMILAGDMNAIPGSQPIDILMEKWTPAFGTYADPTFPSDEPARKIDYIMYYPSDRWDVVNSRVLEEKVASDHRPYLVTLELMPEK